MRMSPMKKRVLSLAGSMTCLFLIPVCTILFVWIIN